LRSFTYIVSHDLRSPLVNVKGFAGELSSSLNEVQRAFERVVDHLDEPDRVRLGELFRTEIPEAIGFISSSVNRMDLLIDAVLKLSRLGHRELMVESVDTPALVGDILGSQAHQLERRGASVHVGPLPVVAGDRMAIGQLLGNVIDNAVKYLDPSRPGIIRISSEEGGDEDVFHIADNGRGIAPADSDKVFEVFRRAGLQDVPGEGMGLAYVKTMVRRLGGRVWYDSVPGEGTTFHIAIPRRGNGKG
jgi:signal transduction histidine kinase